MMLQFFFRFIGLLLNALSFFSKRLTADVAFKIFSHPIRVKLRKDQQDFLRKARLTDIDLDGNKVALYSWGIGDKSILFAHGWASSAFRWRPYVESIDLNEFTVFAVDAVAHGNSSGRTTHAPMYAELISKLVLQFDIKYLVGHSFGGMSLCLMLYENPFLMPIKLVIMSAPGEVKDFLHFFIRSCGLRKGLQVALYRFFEEGLGHPVEYYSTKRFGQGLTCEGLVVHDEYDAEVPAEYAYRLHKHWSRSELYITKGKGHKLRDPEVVKTIVEFVTN